MHQKSLFSAGGEFLEFAAMDRVQSALAVANPFIWEIVNSPWLEFQHDRAGDPRFRDLTAGEAAWWLHTQIKRRAILLAEDSPEFGITRSPENSHQFYLDINGELLIVFKKLVRFYSKKHCCEMLVRSNYPTEGNCRFWEQRRDAGIIDAPRIIVGYEPVQEMTEIRIHVGYPRSRGRKFAWIYEMPNQAEAALKLHQRMVDRDAREQERHRGFTIESRITGSKSGGA